VCFVKLLITLAGEYKLELSEELGQRDEHHAAAAAVLLPHLLHQRGTGADGGDADGYRSNKDVDAAGASAWLVGSIGWTDLARAMFRLAFRTAFLGTQVALAEWFITSGSADVILDLQALTGGVGMAAMTFFIPSVLAYGLLPRESLSDADRRFVYFCFRMGNVNDGVFYLQVVRC
jgi:hypothetical protein